MEKSKIEQFLSTQEHFYYDLFSNVGFGYSDEGGDVGRYTTKNGYGYGGGVGTMSGTGYGGGYRSLKGDGDGQGHSHGRGYFEGYGYGFDKILGFGNIASFCGQKVYIIDGIETIIQSVHGNYAKGFILLDDFTLEKTYIAKGGCFFAHGNTLREATKALQDKIMLDMDIKEKQDEFKRKFNKNESYSGEEFFEWHHLLTGSCLQGREAFVKTKGLDLKAKYTVKDFLKIVEGAYGWNSIKDLKEFYD